MEVHIDEGDVQTSILRKLMIARCLNTAVLMYVVTNFTAQVRKKATTNSRLLSVVS